MTLEEQILFYVAMHDGCTRQEIIEDLAKEFHYDPKLIENTLDKMDNYFHIQK